MPNPSDASMAVAGAIPVTARIDAIDVLRGLALFGVLAINLDTEFRVSFFEQFLPPSVSGSLLDRAVEGVLKSVIEFKAFSLFSFLFGVGLAIQFERLNGRDDRLILLVRRLLALLAFGLIHLVLIWNGDILTEYAVAGFVVLPLLFAPRRILVLAAVTALALYLAVPWLPWPFDFPGRTWLVTHVATAREVYGQGTFGAILAFRVSEIPFIAPLHAYVFPRTVALMLFGGLVWRAGLLARSSAYGRLLGGAAIVAIGLGAFLSLLANRALEPLGLVLAASTVTLATQLVPVVLAIGYAALVVFVVSCTRYRALLGWAAPVGQMAFTNYITQSVVLGLLFYGYGLGLMGRFGVAAGFGVVLAVYIAQVFISRWWLQTHRFGPLEWLWRTLMYARRQPWSRGP